ncbi:MAG: SMP-30/gluconolactonase/LRE family protein, partial [bacterium]
GTMGRHGEAGLGSLYRLDANGSVTQILSGADISNGIVWSPDKRFMYWTDTLKGVIYAFDYDDVSGRVSNRRVAFKLDPADGLPDGMTIDAEGMLWVACWEGGKVIRVDPEAGTKRAEVKLPASRVTSCAFGGADLDRLYITTARMALSDAELTKQPDAGSLFVCEPGVRGIPAVAYAG